MNEFGDERKRKLETLLEPATAETLARIALETEPIVLGITFWNCFRPWRVPERRICDNFFYMTVSGGEQVEVAGERRIFRRGDAMIVPEFVPHAFGLADGCDASSHFIAHALADNVAGENPFGCFATPFLHPAHTDAVLERLTRIVALRNHSPEAAQRLMRHLFLELMEEEAAAGRFRFAERRRSDERITRALAYIRENFSGNIGVADIAAAVHLGEVQLRKLFRREMGMGPAAYLQRARLIHAARLLARYDLPLGEVARRSGFSGECYFATLFRSVFARTPGQYRRYIRGR